MKFIDIHEGNQTKRGIFVGYYTNEKGELKKKAHEQPQSMDWDDHINGKQMYGLSNVKFIKNGNGSKGIVRWIANDVDKAVEPKEFLKNLYHIEPEAFAFTTSSGRWHTYYYYDDFVDVRVGELKAKEIEKKLIKHYGTDKEGVDTGHTLPQGYNEKLEKPGCWLFQPYTTLDELKVKPVCISLSGTPLTVAQFEFRFKWRKHILINASVGLNDPGRHKALFNLALYLRHTNIDLTLKEINDNFNNPLDKTEFEKYEKHLTKSIFKKEYTADYLKNNLNNYIKDLTGIETNSFNSFDRTEDVLVETPEVEKFFDNVVFIKKDGIFYDLRTRSEYKKDSIEITYGSIFKTKRGRFLPPVKQFATNPNAKMVELQVYRPDLYKEGEDPILEDERGFKTLNIFVPGGVDPIEPTTPTHLEELELFKTLLNNLVVEPDEREWILDTLCTIFQRTGKKIRHMPVIFSPNFQIGKSTLFKTIREGLGEKNCAIIGPKQAVDREKQFLADKMLVLIDELKLDNDHKKNVATLNILKPLSTEDRHDVRPLFKGWREVYSTCNFIIFTNHKDAIAVPKNEARYTIIKASKTNEQMGGDKFFSAYWKALNDGTLGAVVKHYLLNRKISKNFRVEGPSLITPALLEMSEQAGHPLFYDVQKAFKEKNEPFERTVFSVSEAWDYLKKEKGLRGKLNDFVDIIEELKCRRVGECKHKVSGKHPVLYLCRNFEFFHGKSNSDIVNKYFLPIDINDIKNTGGKFKLSVSNVQGIKDNLVELQAYEEFHTNEADDTEVFTVEGAEPYVPKKPKINKPLNEKFDEETDLDETMGAKDGIHF